jgi:hypothetical protein
MKGTLTITLAACLALTAAHWQTTVNPLPVPRGVTHTSQKSSL